MTFTSLEYTDIVDKRFHSGEKIIDFTFPEDTLDSYSSSPRFPFDEKTSLATKLYQKDSLSDDEFSLLSIPKQQKETKQKSVLALRIIRTHYTKEILSNLEWLSENHEINNPLSIPYISEILKFISEYSNKHFDDPFSSFLLALYDGLSFNNNYLLIEDVVYKRIYELILALNDQELDYSKIDKYILKLDELGINITPY
jgi:hypothetical protein